MDVLLSVNLVVLEEAFNNQVQFQAIFRNILSLYTETETPMQHN